MFKNKLVNGLTAMILCSVIIISVICSDVSVVNNRTDFSSDTDAGLQSIGLSVNRMPDADSVSVGNDGNAQVNTKRTSAEGFVSDGKTDGETVPVTDENIVQRFVPIEPGNTVTDKLTNLLSENLYTFTVNDRGTVSYSFSHMDLTDITYKWKISLYRRFSVDGDGKNIKYREIYTEYSDNTQDSFVTLNIGVYPGNYRISVKCLNGSENSQYNLCVNFDKNYNYECECNDTLSRYNELPLGKTVKGSGAKLTSGNDIDCFMFKVTEAGYVNLSFLHDDLHEHIAAYRIFIYDVYGNEYYYSVSLMSDILVSSGNIALSPGYYFAEIDTHIFCNSDYWLTVRFSADGMYETENNDIITLADELKPGIETYGSLSQRSDTPDRDWYTFTLTEDSSVVIDFIHSQQIKDNDGWNIELYDSDGKKMYSAVSKWSDNVVQSPFLGLAAGTYYVNINSDNLYFSSLSYALLVINSTGGVWERENNDTFETANIIEPNTEINATLTENGVDYDTDCFVFDMTEQKEINIDFVHPLADYTYEGWIITLCDENGKSLLTFNSKWSNQKTSSDKITLPKGKYYIKVETGMYYSHIKYSLKVNMDPKTDVEIGVDPLD